MLPTLGPLLSVRVREWLELELATNDAQLTLVASSIQVIPTDKTLVAEGGWRAGGRGNWFVSLQCGPASLAAWSAFPSEKSRLFELLFRYSKDTAMLLLSGDVHMAEFTRTDVISSSEVLTLWEFTSSGMTHSLAQPHQSVPEWLGLSVAHTLHTLVTSWSRTSRVGAPFLVSS